MARSSLSDYLQDYSFWLFDVPEMGPLSTPIFTPLSGFATVTAPEMQFEEEAVTEGNWLYKHKIIKRAEVNSLTLTRGVTLGNSDFYNWAVSALHGTPSSAFISQNVNFQFQASLAGVSPRRQLVLVHFFAHLPFDASVPTIGDLPFLGPAASSGPGMAVDALLGGGGAFNFALRVPARAYLLTGCIPTRYKANSDFDAASSAVSISELDIAFEYFEQFSLLGM